MRDTETEKQREKIFTDVSIIILSICRKSLRNPINSVENYLIYNRVFSTPH